MELKINPKFRDVLPKLTASEYGKLEQDILENGCLDPLLIWGENLIDGHNRYGICTAHNIEYETKEIEFSSDDEATMWICLHQLARRNLHPSKRAEILGRYNLLRSKNVGAPRDNRNAEKNNVATVATLNRTREIVAKEAGVSPRTVTNATAYVKALDELPEDEKAQAQAENTSQKAVIEKAREKKEAEKPPIADNFDVFTAEAKRKANQISRQIDDLKESLKQANTFFHINKLNFADFAPFLSALDLSKSSVDLFALRRLEKCPACDGVGCEKCNQHRYLTKEDAETVTKILNK